MASSTNPIAPPKSCPLEPGLIRSPSTQTSGKVLEELLHKDYVSHHCFFNDLGFHNHLPHHLVAAYDMGAPPTLLKQIYEDLAPTLRPIDRQGEDITEGNWTTRLGERKAYGSYLAFFQEQVEKHGVSATMTKYVMAPEANGNGALMLARLFGGVLHPFLQVGFGVEFGQDYMVAQGLAMCAVEEAETSQIVLDMPSGLPEIAKTSKGVTLLGLLREVYDSPVLAPALPYDPNATLDARIGQLASNTAIGTELKRIYSKWSILTSIPSPSPASSHDDGVAANAAECLWQSTLVLAGTSRPGHAPRLDFFLMHLLTSALCLPRMLAALPDPVHKAQLLQGYARVSALFVLLRGRPRIDIPLLMSYPVDPRPPQHGAPGGAAALGDAQGTNPWLAMIQNALHHKDAHVLKAVRTLYYCGVRYGSMGPGEAIGARDEEGKESHVGAGAMDGTVFVRAAGVISDTLGWVAYGAEEGEWDFSGLGWDAAWEGKEKEKASL